ncbi:phosphatidylinositol polyphosphate 5-phosphatase type IV-like [Clavelina lepadiformis]|uniref:Inositol polyphosphate-related phosphatase domain-containing protein n=1 Tax=Clavelina lepadiformis TaxID=159417 RepID=A0ABP0EXD4_CLALP
MMASASQQSEESNEDNSLFGNDSTSVSVSRNGLTQPVLPVIRNCEIKERNFLVGNVTKTSSSFLGQDELDRFFPDRQLSLLVGTWNMQKCVIPSNINDFLIPKGVELAQDIYVIGVQEAASDQREWEVKLQETLGPSYILVYSAAHGVLHLAVFVRRDLIWFCSKFEEDVVTTRFVSQIKTKGALGISFQFFGTSFLFLTAHFHSGETKVKERIDDYNIISQRLQLPHESSNRISSDKKDATEKFDCVFWFGDLNFRISQPHQHMKNELEDPETYDIKEALKCDQLKGCMKRGQVFKGFEEPTINFMPTYKFNVNSDQYDTSKKLRVPSYTDRLLHKEKTPETIKCIKYDCVTTVKHSDHRPVYALYKVALKPGKDSFPLTTGKFKHDIYTEAARRRAKCSKATQSMICSLF